MIEEDLRIWSRNSQNVHTKTYKHIHTWNQIAPNLQTSFSQQAVAAINQEAHEWADTPSQKLLRLQQAGEAMMPALVASAEQVIHHLLTPTKKTSLKPTASAFFWQMGFLPFR